MMGIWTFDTCFVENMVEIFDDQRTSEMLTVCLYLSTKSSILCSGCPQTEGKTTLELRPTGRTSRCCPNLGQHAKFGTTQS
jgi:hypothetical protein